MLKVKQNYSIDNACRGMVRRQALFACYDNFVALMHCKQLHRTDSDENSEKEDKGIDNQLKNGNGLGLPNLLYYFWSENISICVY